MDSVDLESPKSQRGCEEPASPNTINTVHFMRQLEQVLEDIRTKSSSLGLQCALADEEEAAQLQQETQRLEANRQVKMLVSQIGV